MISEEEFGLLDAESGERVALRGVDVSARISGLLAETRLTQRYRNETSTNLELIYTFPLPVSGVLLSFSVTIGDRQYHGEVIPRSKAEVDFMPMMLRKVWEKCAESVKPASIAAWVRD